MQQSAEMFDYVYNDGGRAASGRKGSAGDCVARAIAIASGRPYDEIYNALSTGNARQRVTKRSSKATARVSTARLGINTSRKWFKDYMESLGAVWVPCMTIGSGCKVHTRPNEMPMQGRYVLSLSRHYTALINGVIHDTYNPQRDGTRCVYGYWRFS